MNRLRIYLAVGLLMAASGARGQFLRLGPLDFDATLTLEAIYTTNVDQAREDEYEEGQDMEDIYFVASLDLRSQAYVAPSTDLSLNTSVAVEKHLNREDLDNSSKPFTSARLATFTDLSRYTIALEASYERTAEEEDEVFFPGGSTLTRRERDTYGYVGRLGWELEPFRAGAYYDFSSERYLDEVDQDGDKDDYSYGFDFNWAINRRLGASYTYEKTKTDLINDDENPPWDLTQNILLSILVLEKPSFTYGFGYQKEDTGGEKGDWEYTHNFSLSDEYQLARNLKLSYSMTYGLEEQPEDEDVTFQYSISLDHEISRTARQQLQFTREPIDTFGSTTETDATTYSYSFNKDDLFIYDLMFDFGVSYQINEPVDGPTEEIWNYSTGLRHAVPVSRRLTRSLEYRYTLEDNNTQPQLLEEHRVTLAYSYAF